MEHHQLELFNDGAIEAESNSMQIIDPNAELTGNADNMLDQLIARQNGRASEFDADGDLDALLLSHNSPDLAPPQPIAAESYDPQPNPNFVAIHSARSSVSQGAILDNRS